MLMETSGIIDWIENHEQTISLLKWVALIFVAWIAGIFRFLKQITRKPRVEISEFASSCLICKLKDIPDALHAAFLLEIEVINPSNEIIVVRAFDIKFLPQNRRLIRRWSPIVHWYSLPSRVRRYTSTTMNPLRNWFTTFPDGLDITVKGKIEPKHAESGCALFLSSTKGRWNPRIRDGLIDVYLQAYIATGEKLYTRARIPVTYDNKLFETWIPDIHKHMQDPKTWGEPNYNP